MMRNTSYVALGSNMGDRFEYLERAVRLVDGHEEMKVVNTSSIYETDPVGYTDQDAFLNMVIKIQTELSPFELLGELNEIEEKLDRKREVKWGPRTIDLDILLYNQENIYSENLTVPHPRMQERAFVMIPLLEIDSVTLRGWSGGDSIPDEEGVRIWKRKNGEGVFALFES